MGPGVSTDYAGVAVSVGDLVYWAPYAQCHRCYSCTVLEETPCENANFYEDARKPSWATYAQYASLPPNLAFFRLPDGASADAVAALGCGLPTALRAFERHGSVRRGADVLVLGAGAVGLSAIMLARNGGARSIIVVEGAPGRRKAALRLGADVAIDLSIDPIERGRMIRDVTGPLGPSLVIEAAGALSAYRDAIDIVSPHGSIIVVGIGSDQCEIASSPGAISRGNLTIVGSTFPKPRHYFEAMHLATRLEPELQLSELITHSFPVERACDALSTVRSGSVIKAVITPNAG